MSPAAVIALAGWAAGVGILAFAVVAKLSDWPQARGRWPVRSALVSPAVVTVVEAAVVLAAILPVATMPRFIAVGVMYLCYAVAAVRLRGRDCACFGRLTSRFTPWHAAGCAAVAMLSALAATAPGASIPATTTAAAVAAVAGAVTAAVAWLAHRARRGHAGAIDASHVDHVVIYGSDSCSVCAMLWDQQDYYRSFAGCAVEFRKDTPGEAASIAIGRYPAAVAIGPDGSVVHGPVAGLSQVRDLLRATAVQLPSQRGGEENARIRGAGRDR